MRGPMVAENMLIEILARPDPEEEPSRHHGRGRGRSLRKDGRADAHRRRGSAGAELERLCARGTPPEHTPDKGTLPLLVDPGVIVVGNKGKRKPGLFGVPR